MPRQAFYESDAQCSGSVGYFPSTHDRFIHISQDPPRVFQERFPRSTYFPPAAETIEQFKTNLFCQILNLWGERGWSNAKPLGGASKMLLLSRRNKIS